MRDAWNLLIDLGLPDGAIRPPPNGVAFDPAAVRDAVRGLAGSSGLAAAKVAPLLAWLRAWQHHWPARFASVFGDAEDLLAALQARLDDENRYLKLRRIAIENLASFL